MQRALITLIAAAFALLLGAALYVSAATASVFDKYQPGMSDFRSRVSPGRLILIVVGTPLAATFVPQLRAAAARMARTLARVALATVAAALVALVALDRVEPCTTAASESRDLHGTLRQSLLCPKLSNRSYFVPFYAGALSCFLLWIAKRRQTASHDDSARQSAGDDERRPS